MDFEAELELDTALLSRCRTDTSEITSKHNTLHQASEMLNHTNDKVMIMIIIMMIMIITQLTRSQTSLQRPPQSSGKLKTKARLF